MNDLTFSDRRRLEGPGTAVLPSRAWTGRPGPDVILRAQEGDDGAFETLYRAYRGTIVHHVFELVRDVHVAEELASDAWLKVWVALPATPRDPPLKFAGFLFRVATNVAFDHLRHEKLVQWTPWETFVANAHDDQLAARDDTEREALRRETEREVRAVLDALPASWGRALTLREYGDLQYHEIAAQMGVTQASVKSLIYRSRQALKPLWEAQSAARTEPA